MSLRKKRIGKLEPLIVRLELFLVASYCLCIVSGVYLTGHASRLNLACVFPLGFGIYFLFRGTGALEFLRRKCSSGFFHPLTTPASACGFLLLAAVCLPVRPGMLDFLFLSGLCAAGGPAALIVFGMCVASPVRLSQIYCRMSDSDKK